MLFVLTVCAAVGVHARSAVSQPGSISSISSLRRLRGGLDESSEEPTDALLQATFACNRLYSTVLAEAMSEVSSLRKSIAAGETVPEFGSKADDLLANAAAKFEAETPEGDADVTSLYKDKQEELTDVLTTNLEPVFTSQIALLKEGACAARH